MKSYKKKKMVGGVAPSCVTGPDVSRYLNSCHTANIHNSSPKASLDLDSKFMKYGSGVPLCQSGGGKKSKGKSFGKYVRSLSKKLKLKDNKVGGGYSVVPEEYIAGMPVYKAYSDCCPPAIIGGKLLLGEGGGSVCGQRGGGSKSNKSQRSHRSHKSNKSQRSHRSHKSNKSQRSHRSHKSNKSNKSQRSHRSHKSNKSQRSHRSHKSNKSQRSHYKKGGSYRRSKPGKFPDSFDTVRSHFSETVQDRKFDESQNDYTPLAI